MNPMWNAAQALLAIATECLGAGCGAYARRYVTTGTPVADCDTLAVSIGGARAQSGSCVGKAQLNGSLDIHVIRCCEPVGDLTDANGYTPPTPAAVEKATACVVRDVWAIYQCMLCQACDALGAIAGVTACCNEHVPPPEIMWGLQGDCRGGIVRVPVVFEACCP